MGTVGHTGFTSTEQLHREKDPMDLITPSRTTKGGEERDAFSRASRHNRKRSSAAIKRDARRRDRHMTRQILKQHAA